ncbi:MAG: ABC transporter permease [Clostridia bacterium]|nr:ABC transporter permease [Clostridia bacterium]
MKDLLKFEFRKFGKHKSFYICLIIMTAMLLISGVTYKILADHASEIAEITGGESLPLNCADFILNFLSASSFSLISAVFVAITVCDDYESKIIKTVYARGYSRSGFYFAKLVYVLVAVSVMFIVECAAATVIGAAVFGLKGTEGKTALLLAVQYLACLSGAALYFALSVAIKKLGFSIAAGIFFPMIISLLLTLADSAIKTDKFKVADFWISSFTTSLSSAADAKRIIVCAVLSAVYAAAFIGAGFAFARKTEV